MDKYKARPLAKGYNQIAGIDYVDSFSPVAKLVTVRMFIAIATTNSWPLHQLDINNAFLHAFITEELYMQPPEGYDKAKLGKVCKLLRSLYGLKQASRQWNKEFTTKLIKYGFVQSPNDHCPFTKHTSYSLTALMVYVDDVLLTGTHETDIIAVKQFLRAEFTIKDLGYAKYYLGNEISRSSIGTSLN